MLVIYFNYICALDSFERCLFHCLFSQIHLRTQFVLPGLQWETFLFALIEHVVKHSCIVIASKSTIHVYVLLKFHMVCILFCLQLFKVVKDD